MKTNGKLRTYIYTIIVAAIALSGFAQMPIFKRYYIADIPGLGWLAEFYVTHSMHYIAAILLIAFTIYIFIDFVMSGAGIKNISQSGYLKAMVLAGLIFSGIFMVVRNLPGFYFNHNLIIAMNLLHLMLCMALLAAGAYTLARKKSWLK
jgi:hypothetical protein